MNEDEARELERRNIFRGLVTPLAYCEFVIKPVLDFGWAIERTGAIIRKETTSTRTSADWTRFGEA